MSHQENEPQLSQTTRRDFCTDLLLTSTGLVLALPAVTSAVPQESLVAYPPVRIDGAETLLPGAGLYFNYPGRSEPAVLLRSHEGQFRAYSRKCSHAGCSVEFDSARRCLKCPCHQGTFDARLGYVVFGPPPRPLDEIILQVRGDGQIWAVGKSSGRNTELIAKGPRR